MKNKWISHRWELLLLAGLIVSGCGGVSSKTSNMAASEVAAETPAPVSAKFTQPEIPAVLQSPDERASYAVAHYWDHFDFADTTLIAKAEITEQAFVDYLNLFSHTSNEVMAKSISEMLNRALTGSPAMFDHFAELYEKYLFDPNSPFRQEEYYIVVLQSIIANERIDQIQKLRPRHLLEIALKNRVGNRAENIEFVLGNGRATTLYNVQAEYTILFFNNPDCQDCARVKKLLVQLSDPRVKIVALYPDEDVELWRKADYPKSWINGRIAKPTEAQRYDLKAIPSLYLLDKDKRVVLKDAPIEVILDAISKKAVL